MSPPVAGRVAPSDGRATLAIAQAAQVTGVTVHTLRYYERAGLMRDPIARASSRHRRYTDEDLQWVTLLTNLRSTGMPIRDLARYARLVREGEGNEAERLALLTDHRRRVLARLDEVRHNLAAINIKIDLYQERTGR